MYMRCVSLAEKRALSYDGMINAKDAPPCFGRQAVSVSNSNSGIWDPNSFSSVTYCTYSLLVLVCTDD